VPVVDPAAYASRYGEPDKAATGLGALDAWPVPYWWVDGGAAVENCCSPPWRRASGALLFGLFGAEAAVLGSLGVPPGRRAIGTIALGHPAPDEPGRSATRPRRPRAEVVHLGHW
jgi:nitroreductase